MTARRLSDGSFFLCRELEKTRRRVYILCQHKDLSERSNFNRKEKRQMSCQCSQEVEQMCRVAKGACHRSAPIPEEGKWVKAKEIKDISGLTHGIGWCAPQQGTCKLTLNVKEGVIQEALVETIGCSGMTHSAAMAAEILPGKTILEALNSDLVCDAINVAMRELFNIHMRIRLRSHWSVSSKKMRISAYRK